jgi:hypothetical protein
MHRLCVLRNLIITFSNTNSHLLRGRSRYCTCCGIVLLLKKQVASVTRFHFERFLVTSPLSQHRKTSYSNSLMTISLLLFGLFSGPLSI